jgi:hypothetical protein
MVRMYYLRDLWTDENDLELPIRGVRFSHGNSYIDIYRNPDLGNDFSIIMNAKHQDMTPIAKHSNSNNEPTPDNTKPSEEGIYNFSLTDVDQTDFEKLENFRSEHYHHIINTYIFIEQLKYISLIKNISYKRGRHHYIDDIPCQHFDISITLTVFDVVPIDLELLKLDAPKWVPPFIVRPV